MSKIDMVEFVGYHSPKSAAVEGSYSFIHVLGTQQLYIFTVSKTWKKFQSGSPPFRGYGASDILICYLNHLDL